MHQENSRRHRSIHEEEITECLITLLNQLGVSYCIARNFEGYPLISSDLDLFISPHSITAGLDVIRKLGTLLNIDAIYAYNRTTSNPFRAQRIYTFCILYNNSNFSYTVDFFLGFSILGIKVIGSSLITKSRAYNDQLNFYHIDPYYYALMTALQLSNTHPTNQPIRFQKYLLRLDRLLLINSSEIYNSSPNIYSYLIKCRDSCLRKSSACFSPFVRLKFMLVLTSIMSNPLEIFGIFGRFYYFILVLLEIPQHIIFVSTHVDLAHIHSCMESATKTKLIKQYLVLHSLSSIFYRFFSLFSTVERYSPVVVRTSFSNNQASHIVHRLNHVNSQVKV